ncbi:MAG TPA: hypothetical protein VK184_19580, partial [Nostocaceae cyanobacterium]|nr:hypothetical protein [Nostocaceae cyanobacterium]
MRALRERAGSAWGSGERIEIYRYVLSYFLDVSRKKLDVFSSELGISRKKLDVFSSELGVSRKKLDVSSSDVEITVDTLLHSPTVPYLY